MPVLRYATVLMCKETLATLHHRDTVRLSIRPSVATVGWNKQLPILVLRYAHIFRNVTRVSAVSTASASSIDLLQRRAHSAMREALTWEAVEGGSLIETLPDPAISSFYQRVENPRTPDETVSTETPHSDRASKFGQPSILGFVRDLILLKPRG
jgi:hypothetical protein